jgi:hypothetical protein
MQMLGSLAGRRSVPDAFAASLVLFRQIAARSHREPVERTMEVPPHLQQRVSHGRQRSAKRQHDQGGFEVGHSALQRGRTVGDCPWRRNEGEPTVHTEDASPGVAGNEYDMARSACKPPLSNER